MFPLPDGYSGFLSVFATRNNYDVKLTTRAAGVSIPGKPSQQFHTLVHLAV